MLRITLRQLDVFVATVRHGTLTQAAGAIGLTQSAASMALAEFENLLGARLFERAGKRLFLNENGRALYGKAIELLDRARDAESLFAGPEQGGAAQLKVAVSSTIGNYLLPQTVAAYMRNYPGRRVALDVFNTGAVIQAIREFSADIGLIEGPCADPAIAASVWRSDELAVCAAPSHPLAQLATVNARQLRGAEWILREVGSGTREVVDQMLAEQIGQIRVAMELGGTEAIKRVVETGMGISCLSKAALADSIRQGKLVELNAPSLRLTRKLYLLLHRDKFRSAALSHFIDHCLAPSGGG